MCTELCDVENGATCPDCGRLICWSVEWSHGDDILRPAYATASGDLKCNVCGMASDRAEEEDNDEPNLDLDWEEVLEEDLYDD